jgi:diketogulonate reductase-like aldo/keto reductase
MEFLTLNNGVDLPALGLGVFQTPPEETRVAVETAFADGYQQIDTAAAYGNERQVGEAIRNSGLERPEEIAAIDGLDTGRRGGPEPDAITLETFGREIPEALKPPPVRLAG